MFWASICCLIKLLNHVFKAWEIILSIHVYFVKMVVLVFKYHYRIQEGPGGPGPPPTPRFRGPSVQFKSKTMNFRALILYFLGGLSLHLNHLIAERVSAPDRQFGTLPIGIFLSNLDSGQLETSLMTSYCHFWNLSTFGNSRAVWVFLAKIGCLQKIKVFSMKERRGFDATWGF